MLVESAGGVDDGVDVVAGPSRRYRGKGETNVGGYAGDYQLVAAGGSDRGHEGWVFPGIYLEAVNDWDVGEQIGELFEDGAVGAPRVAGCQDHREVMDLGPLSEHQGVVPQVDRVDIRDSEEHGANLVIDEEHCRVGGFEHAESVIHCTATVGRGRVGGHFVAYFRCWCS